jgi:hypothetical protein
MYAGKQDWPTEDLIPEWSKDRPDRRLSIEKEGTYHEFQPGDATKYRFTAVDSPVEGFIVCAGTPDLGAYPYQRGDLANCYRRLRDYSGVPREEQGPALGDGYVQYIISHSGCNPWTAWALVQCLGEYWGL